MAVAALAALVNAGMLAAPTPAQAAFGTVDIKPIESDIAGRPWTSATASSGASAARRAIDGDPTTSWYADRPGVHSG